MGSPLCGTRRLTLGSYYEISGTDKFGVSPRQSWGHPFFTSTMNLTYQIIAMLKNFVFVRTLRFLLVIGGLCAFVSGNKTAVAANVQPKLIFPVECTPGINCWTVNYMDMNPEPGVALDFRCGKRTYDGHKGTDFAIRDWSVMEYGVDVLAAADGTILRMRDGMKDKMLSHKQRQKLLSRGLGCGNGVFIDHGNGWQTNYCHMKRNSIIVETGDKVTAGQKIGEVGHSGFVEFPHLHFAVEQNKITLDPFTGFARLDNCSLGYAPLWKKNIVPDYEAVSIYAAGFKSEVPDFNAITLDMHTPTTLSSDIPALVFWVAIYGVSINDEISIRIIDPQERIIVEKKIIQKKTRARQFYYVGHRTNKQSLSLGSYIGMMTLSRQLSEGNIYERELSKEILIR